MDNFSEITSIVSELVQAEGRSNFPMLVDNKTKEAEDEHEEDESETEVGE